jgi:hypothetical protein
MLIEEINKNTIGDNILHCSSPAKMLRANQNAHLAFDGESHYRDIDV